MWRALKKGEVLFPWEILLLLLLITDNNGDSHCSFSEIREVRVPVRWPKTGEKDKVGAGVAATARDFL